LVYSKEEHRSSFLLGGKKMKKIIIVSFIILFISAFKWPGHCGAQDPEEMFQDGGLAEYEE